jgi:predicted DNA-binding protein
MKHVIESYDVEPPSNVQMLLGMITKTANEEATAWTQTLSIRMPMMLACTFDAMAHHSGQSRNKLIVKALEATIDEIWGQIPEDERTTLEDLRSQIINHKIDAKEGESGAI